MIFKNKNSRGFTLLEILLVIGIVSVLAGIVIMAINPSRQLKVVRDTERKSDIAEINKAMVQYYIDEGHYPNLAILSNLDVPTEICNTGNISPYTGDCGSLVNLSELVPIYLTSIPQDPNLDEDDPGTDYKIYINTPPRLYVEASSTELGDTDGFVSYVGPVPSGYELPTVGASGVAEEEEEEVPWACGDNVTFTYNGATVTYGSVFNATTSECWLDRNLGASRVAQSYDDSLAFGDLFQWGRGDDGHQVRTSDTQSGQVSTTTPGTNTFIIPEVDWTSIDSNMAIRTAFLAKTDGTGICPPTFRVPTITELNNEHLSWTPHNFNGAFASPLKLTAAGFRNYFGGVYDGSGSASIGFYMSGSGVNGTNNFNSVWLNSTDAYLYSDVRAYGTSVRCILD